MAVPAVVAASAVAAWVAESAWVALCTGPRVASLICVPVSVLRPTFEAVTAPRASLTFVTAAVFSCLVPTLLAGSLIAA